MSVSNKGSGVLMAIQHGDIEVSLVERPEAYYITVHDSQGPLHAYVLSRSDTELAEALSLVREVSHIIDEYLRTPDSQAIAALTDILH